MPLAAKQAALDRLQGGGKIMLDCPISGTGAQAANKDLIILGSGDEAAFARCAEVFAGMSRVQRYFGAFGRGSAMRYIANYLVTIHNVAAAEAMVLGMKAGLEPSLVYETLADSAGTSRMFQMRGPLMRDQVYVPPTATVRMHRKDLSISMVSWLNMVASCRSIKLQLSSITPDPSSVSMISIRHRYVPCSSG